MRPGLSGPEATQEIDPSDVLEVLQVTPDKRHSYPSLLRVGIDIEMPRTDETCQMRVATRRKELSRYVIGAVAFSCLILVIAFVKREVGASNGPTATSPMSSPTTAARPTATATATSPAIPPPPPPASAQSSSPTVAELLAADTPDSTSGSIRFVRPAKAGWVWLDGKRLTGTSAIVTCGTHQVKVATSRSTPSWSPAAESSSFPADFEAGPRGPHGGGHRESVICRSRARAIPPNPLAMAALRDGTQVAEVRRVRPVTNRSPGG